MINRFTQLLNKNFHLLFFLILFVFPFFWFDYPQLDLGGDSVRVYLFDPVKTIKYTNLYPLDILSGTNSHLERYVYIPQNLILSGIKFLLFDNSFLLNSFLYSLNISLSYLFFYKILVILFKTSGKEENILVKMMMIVTSLFFSLSPLIIYDYQRANLHVYGYSIYIIFIYNFLSYLHDKNIKRLILNVLLIFFFGTLFSEISAPWLIPFFFFLMVFLFYYSIQLKKVREYLFGVGFTLLYGFLVSFYHLYSTFLSLKEQTFVAGYTFVEAPLIDIYGVEYFNQLSPYVKLIFNLFDQSQIDMVMKFGNTNYSLMFLFGYYLLPIFVLFPFGLVLGLTLNKKLSTSDIHKKLYLFSVLMFLILAFFVTVNLGLVPIKIYNSLFYLIPGFRMFRHFIGKFSLTFMFFYSIVFFYSLINIFYYVKRPKTLKYFKILLLVLLFLVIYTGVPLISGSISNSLTPGVKREDQDYYIPLELSGDYLTSIEFIEKVPIDTKTLSFPLTSESYQVIKGVDGGAYLGPSLNAVLSGKNDFNGIGSFFNVNLHNTFMSRFYDEDSEHLKRFLGMMNIGLIFHNEDPKIYENFEYVPWGEFKTVFPEHQTIKNLLGDIGAQNIFTSGHYNLYLLEEYFLPHIYVPELAYSYDEEFLIAYSKHNFSDAPVRTAIYSEGESPEIFDTTVNKMDFKIIPDIGFRKINPTKYTVRVTGASGPYVIVLSDKFDPNWKVYLKEKGETFDVEDENLVKLGSIYSKITTNLVSASTNYRLVKEYFDGDIREYTHSRSFLEPETFETWGKKPIAEGSHYEVNGYANSWLINLQDTKGLSDYELIIEYTKNRPIFLTGPISLGVVFLVAAYLTGNYLIIISNKLVMRFKRPK